MQVFSEAHSLHSDSATSFVHLISHLNFKDVLSEESSHSKKNIVQIGEMRYKVIDSDQRGSSVESYEDCHEGSANFMEEISVPTDVIDPLPHSLQLQLIPIQVEPFLAQLPHHLTTFINELVKIVKMVNSESGDLDYRFHFKHLNLDVVFSQRGEKLTIVLYVGDQSMQDDFNHERHHLMGEYLNSKLDFDDIDLQFEFMSFEENESSFDDSDSDEDTSDDQLLDVSGGGNEEKAD